MTPLTSPSSPRLLSLMIPTHDEETGKRLTPVERLTYAQRHMAPPPAATDDGTRMHIPSPIVTKPPEQEECVEEEDSDNDSLFKDKAKGSHDQLNRSIVGEHGFERPDGFFGGSPEEEGEVPRLSPLSTPPRRSWTPKAELTISPDKIIRNPLGVDEEESIPEIGEGDDPEIQEVEEPEQEIHECSTDKAPGADKVSPLHKVESDEEDQETKENELSDLNEVTAEVESLGLRQSGEEGGESESAEAEDPHDYESARQAPPSDDVELKHEDIIGGFLKELTADSVDQGGENSGTDEESASLASIAEVSVQVAELAQAVKNDISECQSKSSDDKDIIALFPLYPESLNNFQQMSNQRRATTILMANKIDAEFIDGSDPDLFDQWEICHVSSVFHQDSCWVN